MKQSLHHLLGFMICGANAPHFILDKFPAPGGDDDDCLETNYPKDYTKDQRQDPGGQQLQKTVDEDLAMPDSTNSIPGANRAKRCHLTAGKSHQSHRTARDIPGGGPGGICAKERRTGGLRGMERLVGSPN